MIITILIINLTTIMFWQPHFSSNRTYAPQRKPKELEIYILNINKLIDRKQYAEVADLLVQTKYSKKQLPIEYWKKEISGKLSQLLKESKQISILENLEKILDS